MNTPVKLLIGFGSVGGIAGGGIALSNYLSQEDSIQKQLENEGFRILPKTDSEWDKIILSYKTVIAGNSKLKFAGKDITSAVDLQERCQETLNKNVSENNDTNNYLKQAKKWCIVPTTVSDGLKGRRILKLNNDKDATEDQNDWNQKIKDYTKTGKNNEIKDLKFASPTPIQKPEKNHRDLIRNKCKELNDKKSYEADYDEALKSSTDWCSVEK